MCMLSYVPLKMGESRIQETKLIKSFVYPYAMRIPEKTVTAAYVRVSECLCAHYSLHVQLPRVVW